MEKIDFGLERKILEACFKTFPKACVVKEYLSEKLNIEKEIIEAEIVYMEQSGLLCYAGKFYMGEENKGIPANTLVFITAKGIDYLHDGGLGARINKCMYK